MDIKVPEYLYDYPNTRVECVVLSTNYSDGFVLYGRNPAQLSQWQYQQYKLFNGKLYPTAKGNYSSSVYVPQCIPVEDLVYKPEYKDVLFPALSIILFSIIGLFAYFLILHPWWRKRV